MCRFASKNHKWTALVIKFIEKKYYREKRRRGDAKRIVIFVWKSEISRALLCTSQFL
jgi:hypothetical protein